MNSIWTDHLQEEDNNQVSTIFYLNVICHINNSPLNCITDQNTGEEDTEDKKEEETNKAEVSTSSTAATLLQTPPKKMDTISNRMENLKLKTTFKRFSLKSDFPFVVYDYTNGNRKFVTVDYFVKTMSKENYSPKISKDGKALLLETKVPPFFIDPGRLLLTNQEHRGFNNNTSECVAFFDVAQRINNVLDYSVDIKGDPQVVSLPFKV